MEVKRRPDVFFADVKLDRNDQVVFGNLLEITRNKYYMDKKFYFSGLEVHEIEFRDNDRYKGRIVWQIERIKVNSGKFPSNTNLPKRIIYGKKPIGMEEVIQAKPLNNGTLYKLTINTAQVPVIAFFMVESDIYGRLKDVRTLNDSKSLAKWKNEKIQAEE
jgi:hypothetical protein